MDLLGGSDDYLSDAYIEPEPPITELTGQL